MSASSDPTCIAHNANEQSPLLGKSQNGTAREDNERGASQAEGEQEDGEPLADEPTTRQLVLVLSSIWLGVFFGAADMTIISTLAPAISSSFDSLSLLSWLASSYIIANAACQPISGKLTDIFGRRAGLIVSTVLFGAGNLMCGLAQSESMMIAGRVIAGMGGGGLMIISTFVTSDLVPLRKRGLWQGFGNLCFGAGAGVGGTFGGWMNDTVGWRWAFLIQVPFMAISCVAIIFTVKIPVKDTGKSRLKRVDFLGAGLLVTGLCLLLVGLNTGGNQLPWNHPLILTTLPLSVVIFGAFVYVEDRIAVEPIIPVRLVLHRTVAATCFSTWLCTMAVFATYTYAPIYFLLQGMSTTQAGLRTIPTAVATSIGSIGTGFIMRGTGRYYIFMCISQGLLVLWGALMSSLTLTTPGWQPVVYLGILGLAYGGILTVGIVALIAAVDHQHQAVTTSAYYAFRSTGSTIGITIASAVFQNVLKTQLWAKFGDRENAGKIIPRIRDDLDEIKRLPHSWRSGVMDSYMMSLRGVFLSVLGMAILSGAAALFMREHTLHKNLARR